MSASLTKEQWQQIDPLIFACNILGAIQAIRSALGCGIVDAIEFALTGNITRLAGAGTAELSVKLHAPHVDSSKKP